MWKNVNDVVPNEDGLYLCWHKDWSMEVVRYRTIYGFDVMGAGGQLPMFWMQLPSPPTAGDSGAGANSTQHAK